MPSKMYLNLIKQRGIYFTIIKWQFPQRKISMSLDYPFSSLKENSSRDEQKREGKLEHRGSLSNGNYKFTSNNSSKVLHTNE